MTHSAHVYCDDIQSSFSSASNDGQQRQTYSVKTNVLNICWFIEVVVVREGHYLMGEGSDFFFEQCILSPKYKKQTSILLFTSCSPLLQIQLTTNEIWNLPSLLICFCLAVDQIHSVLLCRLTDHKESLSAGNIHWFLCIASVSRRGGFHSAVRPSPSLRHPLTVLTGLKPGNQIKDDHPQ